MEGFLEWMAKFYFLFKFFLFLDVLGLSCSKGLSLLAPSGGYSPAAKHRFQGHRLQQLWHAGLAAPRHMETSETRDGTHCPCTDRQVFLYFLKYIHNLLIFILVAPGLYCCTRTFSSCNRQGLLFQCTGFSLQWLLLLQSRGSRTWAQQLWCKGLEAPRGRTCVPCVHRQVPIH